MTITTPPIGDVTWAMVEDGFYVGSRDGEFLGYVDRRAEDRFAVCDMHSRPAGTLASLEEAMEALCVSSNRAETGEDR